MDAESAAVALSVIAARERMVIVDLAGLKFLDASGLAAPMRVRQHAARAAEEFRADAPVTAPPA